MRRAGRDADRSVAIGQTVGMGRWTAWATACLLGLGWVGCEGGGQEPVLPAGHWVYGSAPALAPVLDVCGSMSGTPVKKPLFM